MDGHSNLTCVEQFPPLPATTSGSIGTEQVPLLEILPPLPTQEANGIEEMICLEQVTINP
jgi:hypothetical protein